MGERVAGLDALVTMVVDNIHLINGTKVAKCYRRFSVLPLECNTDAVIFFHQFQLMLSIIKFLYVLYIIKMSLIHTYSLTLTQKSN